MAHCINLDPQKKTFVYKSQSYELLNFINSSNYTLGTHFRLGKVATHDNHIVLQRCYFSYILVIATPKMDSLLI